MNVSAKGRCHIAFLCAGVSCGPNGLGAVQTVFFEALHETWGGMIEAMRAAGWRVDLDEAAQVTDVHCPACSGTETAACAQPRETA